MMGILKKKISRPAKNSRGSSRRAAARPVAAGGGLGFVQISIYLARDG
jgi:hypothetical protein